MQVDIKVWLYDVLNAIVEIEGFLWEPSFDFDTYQNHTMARRAVERNLEIIGEAINRILRQKPDISIKSAKQIVQTRNQIIHQYDVVSDHIIWDIIQNHLPVLKQDVERLLN